MWRELLPVPSRDDPSPQTRFSMSGRIKPEKLYMVIMDEISRWIEDNHLCPGDRIPSERTLAESLSVSRTSVRLAITAMVERGVLTIHRGSGIFVNGNEHCRLDERLLMNMAISQISSRQIVAARRLIECETVFLCAKNADDLFCSRLNSLLERRRIAEDRGDSYDNMNREFHLAIAEGSENYVYLLLMKKIVGYMKECMWMYANARQLSGLDTLNLHLDQHEEIAKAICSHDANHAREIMSIHILDSDSEMSMLFEK